MKEHLGKIADVYTSPGAGTALPNSAGSTPTGGSTPSHAPQSSPLHGKGTFSVYISLYFSCNIALFLIVRLVY